MRLLVLSIILTFVVCSTSYSLEPVRGAVKYTGGGSVAVEVQLYDFATSTNVYPGAGDQNLGSFSANASGIISFVVGEGDATWTTLNASTITNNYMLIVKVGGTVAAYIRLDDLLLEQGKYGTSIGTIVFDTQSNVTSNRLGSLASDDFVFGSDQLADDGDTDHDSRFFFDKSKSAFRAGYVTHVQWDELNLGNYSFASGYNNIANRDYSIAAGGNQNTASDEYSAILGGSENAAGGEYSTVGGGNDNSASGDYSFIGGGSNNNANSNISVICGGFNNNSIGLYSFIGGGASNYTGNIYSTVGGGSSNSVTGNHSTICGGLSNQITENLGTIGGGNDNDISGYYCTISGGINNTASAQSASVGGGSGNTAAGQNSTIAGGSDNTANDDHNTISGGWNNTTSLTGSIVCGGTYNTASGPYSSILGGSSNTANGPYNLVYGEDVDPSVMESHRIYFFSAGNPGMMAINREDADHPIHVGTDGSNGNGAHLTAGGTWTNGSSITFKDRFADLNDDFIINSIMKLPVKSWHYKGTNEMHIGPFAEDFYTIFGTGDRNSSDIGRYLSTIDVAGVSLRGVQILVGQNEKLRVENKELRREIDEIKLILKEIKDKID
jgi:hypothetical protein